MPLDSMSQMYIPPWGTAGAVTLNFATGDGRAHELPERVDPQGNAAGVFDLPVTGFMAYNIINTHAQPEMVANYGGAFQRRATTSCVGLADLCGAANTANGAAR
jgi:hypothetical protein